jgi:hypothetical protein
MMPLHRCKLPRPAVPGTAHTCPECRADWRSVRMHGVRLGTWHRTYAEQHPVAGAEGPGL